MNKIADFFLHRPVCSAILLAVLATISTLPQGIPGLHNDDLQIYFLLLNGGADGGAVGYSLFTNYALGWIIAQLSFIFPSCNIYLIYLFLLAFIACCCVNYFVLGQRTQEGRFNGRYDKIHLLITVLLLLLINRACLRLLQYTHVAMWASVVSVLLMSSIHREGRFLLKSILAIFLMLNAFALRESSVVPALCVALCLCVVNVKNLRMIALFASVILLLSCVHFFNNSAYNAVPEWSVAKRDMSIRQKILDSPDNSDVNKAQYMREQGIDPDVFESFKSFVYCPSMQDEAKLNKALNIHRMARRGFLGSQFLADKGFLEVSGQQRMGEHDTVFRAITPWIPLVSAFLIWLPGAQRRTMCSALGMLGILLCYLGGLVLFQRMVGRVVNPVLYGAAIWMMALPLKKRYFSEMRLTCVASICVALVSFLFVNRHWPSFTNRVAERCYCEAHPDKLYLTMQVGKDLYPRGFGGYSYRWMSQTNVLPIADGWCYYTPAYEAALRKHGFQSYEAAFMHPNTRIIANKKNVSMLGHLEKLAECEWGKKVELSIEDSFGELYFVKVNQK
ncbi:MAG: hypothetical protein IJ985_01120 [Akkermansia sp.]|nr:hypothetical protein [Akkermansia sp.]